MTFERLGRLPERAVGVLLFAIVLTLFLLVRTDRAPTDTSWTIPTSLSLARSGDLDLNEYPYAKGDPNGVLDVDGRQLSFFPLATPILISPAVAAADIFARPNLDLYAHLQAGPDWLLLGRLNLIFASIITAATVVVIYANARLILRRVLALLVALTFAFGSSLWTTASRDLWQHTLSALMLAVALNLLLRSRRTPRLVQYAAVPLALAYTIRPTNSVSVALITVWVVLAHRRYLLRYLIWAGLIAVPFFALNLATFGQALPPYFLSSRLGWHPAFPEALAGNLVSPARGLLVYTPSLVFAVYGVATRIRQRAMDGLDWTLLAILLGHWIAISAFWHWWGGASYGPRFMTDMLPYLAYFLALGVAALSSAWSRRRDAGRARRAGLAAAAVVFGAVALLGFLIHLRGVTDERTWEWNGARPLVVPSVDDEPSRVWSWRDPQFARGLRPARLDVDVGSICFRPGVQASPTVTITVRNLGDQPLTWQDELPARVFRQSAEQRVGPLGYSLVVLIADVSQIASAPRSIGGIQLRAEQEGDWPLKRPGDALAIPVAVDPRQNAEPGCLAAPDDLLIDGKPQDEGAGLRAYFGKGWFDEDGAQPETWRWTSSPARLLVYSVRPERVRLRSKPVNLYQPGGERGAERGILRVSLNGAEAEEIPVRVGESFEIELRLEPGWNVAQLELKAGNFRPVDLDPSTGDARTLSFALGPIDLQR